MVKTLATGSEEGTIWMRRMDTGAIRYFPPVHNRTVLSVAFSPDGKTLASGSRDGTIGLWDIETGKLRRSLTGHTDAVNIVAFSPDGKTLASGSSDSTVRLWNSETGELKKTFLKHKHENKDMVVFITELVFSPDGKMIASGGTEWPELLVWEIKTGKVRLSHHSHNWSVDALAFSPDGTKLVIGGDTEAVEWLDLGDKDFDTPITPKDVFPTDHPGWVNALAFSSDDEVLTTVTRDGTIRFWIRLTGIKYLQP